MKLRFIWPLPLVLIAVFASCGGPRVPKQPGASAINFEAADHTPESCDGTGLGLLGFGNWSTSMPSGPEDAVVILDPGHGGIDGGACIASDPGKGGCNNVACKSELKAAGIDSLTEAQFTLATALRLKATLERMGFKVGLTRTGGYGKRGLSVSATMSGNTRTYMGSDFELELRGWKCKNVFRRCPWLALQGKGRVHQILDSLGVPLGNAGVADARISYISIHYDSYQIDPSKPRKIGPLIFTSKVRDASNQLSTNPALGGAGPVDFDGNYARHLFDHLIASVRSSGLLPQYSQATEVRYEDGFYPGSTSFSFAQGPLQGSGLQGSVRKRAGNFGTVSVASGITGVSKKPKDYIVSIPQNLTFEVANLRDCRNVPALAKSIARAREPSFDAEVSPPDPSDPIDVAAEDIAHGLVEYYESYVPGFKQKACDNLKNSDWKDHMPDWCPGGGGANAPDIDGANLTPSNVELPLGDGASATLSFRNVGGSDLNYSVSSSDPVVSLGPPSVVPAGAGVSNPYATSQSGTLPPNTAANISVAISCTTAGNHSGEVVIQSNDPYEPQVHLGFTVRCVPPEIGVDELPAYQTAFNYIAPAGESRSLLKPPFDFYEAGGKAKLEFELEAPEWLHLPVTQGQLDPGARFSDLLGNNYGEVACSDAGEQEGYVVVRSNDPDNPEVQIPVRLMCAELEVVFNPDTYDDNLGLLSGVITVHGADHLKEMYARVINDGNGGQTVQYTEPRFVYKAKLVGYLAYRWPVLHAAGDEYSPWDWSSFPDIPFVSWVNSWAFDDGTHQVEEFSLYRPGAFEEGESLPRNFVAYLSSPAEYTITTTAPWGYAVNSSGYKERVNSYGKFQFYLSPGEKKRLNSELMTFDWDVFYYDSDGHEVHRAEVTAYSPMIGLGTRFLCRFSTVSDAAAATAPYVPDARPPDFWQLNIPYAGPRYHVVARWCYQSYSVSRSPDNGAPWWTGEEPEVVPALDWP